MSSRRRSRSPERDRRSRSRSPDRSGDRGNSRYGGTHDQKDRYGGGRYGYGRDSRDDDDNGWRGRNHRSDRNTHDARFAYLCLLSDTCLLLTVRAEHRVPQTSRDDQTSKMSEAEIKAQEVAAARKSRMAMLKRMQGKS